MTRDSATVLGILLAVQLVAIKQSLEGVWIYSGWADKAALRFYPHHRIIQMVDQGEVPR